MLSDYGFLNSTLVLMNYLVVAATFLELVVVVEWLELPETEGKIAEKAARMTVPIETAAL
jgi:hypothetical protein